MKITFGSHSFGLTTPLSDIDIATFVFPSIEDLYDGKMINEMSTSEEEDNRIMDIRILGKMFEKTISMNLVDYCTSQMIEMDSDEKEIMDTIHANIDEYVYIRRYSFAMNLIAYGAEKLKEAVKISEARRESIEATGYDKKSVATFYRNAVIVERLLSPEKRTARDYIYFYDGDPNKEILKNLKIGKDFDYGVLYSEAIKILESLNERKKEVIALKIKNESGQNLQIIKKITETINDKIKEICLSKLIKR